MFNFIANYPFAAVLLIGMAGFGTYALGCAIQRRHQARYEQQRREEQAAEYGGLWPGDRVIDVGLNWQLICPDCGTFNIMHRSAGIACRHCRNELLIVPEKKDRQGGTVEPMGVISRVTQASHNRVMWYEVSPNAPRHGATRRLWSPEVFGDIPAQSSWEPNPPTDLDWDRVHPYMPVVCPSCAAEPLADCLDCRRTGIRFVPLASWRKDGARRVSMAGLSYLRLNYGARTGGHRDDAVQRFNGLLFSGHGGWGALVMEGRRSDLATQPDENDDIQRAKDAGMEGYHKPDQTAARSYRDGGTVERPIGGYQPRPSDDEGRALSRPPRKP